MHVAAFTLPQGPELIIILVVLTLLFGAKKLPELGSSVGKTLVNFKQGMAEVQADVDEAAGQADDAAERAAAADGALDKRPERQANS